MREWSSIAAVVGLAAVASWGCGQRQGTSVESRMGTAAEPSATNSAKSPTDGSTNTSAQVPAKTRDKPTAEWPQDPNASVTVSLLGTMDEVEGISWGSDGRTRDGLSSTGTKCQLTIRLSDGASLKIPLDGTVAVGQKDTVVQYVQMWPVSKLQPLPDVVAWIERMLDDSGVSLGENAQAVFDEWKTHAAKEAGPKRNRLTSALGAQGKLTLTVTKAGVDQWRCQMTVRASSQALAAKIHEVASAWCVKPTFVLARGGSNSLAMFSPDGDFLVICADLWDIKTREKVATLPCNRDGGMITGLQSCSDDKRIAFIQEKAVCILEIESRDIVREITAENTSFGALSPDFSRVLAFPNGDSVEIWSVEKAARDVSFEWEKRAVGRSRYSATGQVFLMPRNGGQMSVWDAKSGERLFVCKPTLGVPGIPLDGIFTNDGKRLLTGSSHAIDAYDLTNGDHLFHISTRTSHCLAISPDGKYLAGGSWGGQGVDSVHVYDRATQGRIAELGKLKKSVYTIAFSPDGRWLAAGLSDGNVAVWDMREITTWGN